MSSKPINPIAIQSKSVLQEAFINLLMKHSYDDITIKAITTEADLSRRTFYRHYSTKENILSDIFERFYLDYLNHLKVSQVVELPDITEAFFSFWAQHIDFLRLINTNKMTHLFLEKMNTHIPNIYHQVKGHMNEYKDKDTLEYALAFSVGGHFNTLILWMEQGANKKPSEMKQIIQTALRVNTI